MHKKFIFFSVKKQHCCRASCVFGFSYCMERARHIISIGIHMEVVGCWWDERIPNINIMDYNKEEFFAERQTSCHTNNREFPFCWPQPIFGQD